MPTKLTRLIAVRPPSLIWKTTSARLSPSGVTINSTVASPRPWLGVVLGDVLDVALQLGVGQDAARLGLQELEQDVVLDLLVAADDDRVDDRVLDDGHHKPAAADGDAHVGEETGAVKRLHRLVDFAAAERPTRLDQDVVADRRRVDARVAAYHDAGDDGGLGRSRRDHQRSRAGNATGEENKREGRTPYELPE